LRGRGAPGAYLTTARNTVEQPHLVGDLARQARLVWVIDPDRRLARVYRHDGTETTLHETEPLDGEDVLLKTKAHG
jgi:hypothetical protein